MSNVQSNRLLRAALVIDAAASGTTGLLQTTASGFTAALTGLPTALILGTGIFYLAYAASLAVMARLGALPRAAVRIVIVGNALWALGCVALATLDSRITGLGIGYLLLQAAAVATFAGLQAWGLAGSPATASLSPQRA